MVTYCDTLSSVLRIASKSAKEGNWVYGSIFLEAMIVFILELIRLINVESLAAVAETLWWSEFDMRSRPFVSTSTFTFTVQARCTSAHFPPSIRHKDTEMEAII
jgi:hypothetical protein